MIKETLTRYPPASLWRKPSLPTQMPSIPHLQRKIKQMDLTKQELIGQESWRAEKAPWRQAVIPQPQMNKGLPLGGGLLGQMAATPHCVGRAKQRCPYSEPPANCSTLLPFCNNSSVCRDRSESPAWEEGLLNTFSLPLLVHNFFTSGWHKQVVLLLTLLVWGWFALYYHNKRMYFALGYDMATLLPQATRARSSQTWWDRAEHQVLAKSTAPKNIYQAPASCLLATLRKQESSVEKIVQRQI